MIILVSVVASLAALVGGAIAIKMKDRLHLVLGFSAGAVMGAALFDLIPEAMEIGGSYFRAGDVTTAAAIGFLAYLILDRLFSFHCRGHSHECCDDDCCPDIHGPEQLQTDTDNGESSRNTAATRRGSLGAASFCIHSLIDGVAIGLSFQASVSIGIVVAIAVVAHRFSDGINTVGIILKNRGQIKRAIGWLIAVGVAPVVGTMLTFAFSVPDNVLATVLAVFAGFFLYIGASDLIPEGHHSHSKVMTTVMTLVGAAVLYIIVSLAHSI